MKVEMDRYNSILMRVKASKGKKVMSPEEITIALDDEINYYREKLAGLQSDDLNDYKTRMIVEYYQVRGRYNKLHKMLVKCEAGTLDFTPDCPVELLKRQKKAMGEYLNALEIRAEVENIDLGW